MRQRRSSMRFGKRMLLTALFLGIISPFAGAQGISGLGGGGASGGGLNSTGGAGGGGGGNGSTGNTATGVGTSSPLVTVGGIAALKNGSAGLAALANTSGATSSSTNTVPVTSDPFSPFYINPYSAGNTT